MLPYSIVILGLTYNLSFIFILSLTGTMIMIGMDYFTRVKRMVAMMLKFPYDSIFCTMTDILCKVKLVSEAVRNGNLKHESIMTSNVMKA